MSTVIRIVDLQGVHVGGQPVPRDTYVIRCDFDAAEGLGIVDVTTDIKLARKFAGTIEAMRYYNTVSKKHPVRPDGEPNRPLTAYTVELSTVE